MLNIPPPELERDEGATFALDDVGFFDFETRSKTTELREAGPVRYACEAEAIIISYAIGGGPRQVVAVRNFDRALAIEDMPLDFIRHQAKVEAGNGIWAAWNTVFDRSVWNYSTEAFPVMHPHHAIDVMAQAVASGLAPDLGTAAKQSKSFHKDAAGKNLIKLFCVPGATATPQSHPIEWAEFCSYAGDDVESMRSIFLGTRQLPWAEWAEYWAAEAINDRGIHIDTRLAAWATRLAIEDKRRSALELQKLTGDQVYTVDQVARMTDWLRTQLPPEGRDILEQRAEEVDEDGNITKPAKYTLKRRQVEKLIALCKGALEKQPELKGALRVLQIRLYGGSKTPAKFGKLLKQHVDGLLAGQLVYNGASQTGRFSSKGAQVHNLARDALPYEHEAIEQVLDNCSYDELAAFGDGDPVSRKLSLMIRPTFIAREGHSFVWSDFSQIEARVLPWLAGDERGALARLEVFRAVDVDPKVPDIYTRTAATLSHVFIEQVTKSLRQRGKVAELALGFGGGVGALLNMGAGYGLHITEEEARYTVATWRAANQWCVKFWGSHEDGSSFGLWGAVNRALEQPMTIQRAGRISYFFHKDYLGGSLLCILPSGRMLTYRAIRYERVADLDDDDQVVGYSTRLRCARGYGRIKLWHGMFCENVVQAVAADCLRGTLRRLEYDIFKMMPVRLHVHDEVLVETLDEYAETAAQRLRNVMQHGFDWSEGLPLMSQETISPYYTKALD